MEPQQTYLSVLVALNAALLLIIAGLAKKQLESKRAVLQPVTRRQRHDLARKRIRLPRRLQVGAIVAVCLGGAVAAGASYADAVAPPALVAFVAAAALILVATR